MTRIIDCFIYNDEPIAKERILYLEKEIDCFYLFEPNILFNGLVKKTKTAHHLLQELPHIADKIKIFSLDNLPITKITKDSVAEVTQDILTQNIDILFTEMRRILLKNIKANDICFIGFAEEIPMCDLIDFVKINHNKLHYPVHALGDYFYGSSIHASAVTNFFHTRNFVIDKKTLKEQKNLLAVRDSDKKYILMKSPHGIGIINPSVHFDHDKTKHKNINLIHPLVIKFSDFLSVKDFYRKLLGTCQILNQKEITYPIFKNNAISKDIYHELINADFKVFKEKLLYFAHHLQVFNNTRHKYMIDNIPAALYEFGVDIAEEKCSLPHDVILMNYYNELYPFA